MKKKNNISGLTTILRNKKIIKCIIIISLINGILSKINYCGSLLFKSSEIILKIDKTGKNKILNKANLGLEYSCPSIIYLNDIIQTLEDCSEINIITSESIVKLVWDNPLTSIYGLFSYCITITEIKFLNFDTSSLTNAAQLFRNCISLTSVDISNLNNLNINSLTYMFYNCNSLKYINLFNFDTSNIKEMNKMFVNCKDLTSIDLSNFDTSNVENMDYLFYNCEKLEYINLFNFRDDSIRGKTKMFSRIANNTVICIDENKAPSIYNLIVNNFPCVVISCNSDWRNVQKKIIKETGECCDNCPDNTTPINNICYSNEEICDSNCKTCNISETIPSTICSSCYENKFLKNGKCVDSCENDYYSDEIEPSIKICKCDIPKCEKCSSESISNNLCLSCNNEKGYYPLLNDMNNIDDFIECYTGDITGYYLDNNDNYYKPCYNTCSKCSSNGNENNHNCNECKEGYDLIIIQDLYSNCVPKCINSYHYFNQENKYICLNSLICPENYNKLIEELGECINDCSRISNYQYEFRKKCYN